MHATDSHLFHSVVGWLNRSTNIKSAVLFGSSAAVNRAEQLHHVQGADLDLHIIVADGKIIAETAWDLEFPEHELCIQACRPATGGVTKITLVFTSGQIDLVVVPISLMRIASISFRSGLYTRVRKLSTALNEIATCLHAGYRFLKGERSWGNFYKDVCMLAGVRLEARVIRDLANASMCDVLWLFQKLATGELIAAQHVLHSRVSDTNLRLWRELRLRKNLPLQSFGLGRCLESNTEQSERGLFSISARLVSEELYIAGWMALSCLISLMAQLDPEWAIPRGMMARLEVFRKEACGG